jgi:hypothetical protein
MLLELIDTPPRAIVANEGQKLAQVRQSVREHSPAGTKFALHARPSGKLLSTAMDHMTLVEADLLNQLVTQVLVQ